MQAAKESRYDKEALVKFFQTVGAVVLSSLEIVLLLLDLKVGALFSVNQEKVCLRRIAFGQSMVCLCSAENFPAFG